MAGPNMSSRAEGKSEENPFVTGIPQVSVTEQRSVFRQSKQDVLTDTGTVRANIAADVEHPNGTIQDNYAARNRHRTVLQQHCDYWDTDQDGVIWPQDTYYGCRKWGWNIFLAGFTAWIIHSGLSYPTVPGLLPDLCFRIYLGNIHKAKHGSDSTTFDTEGRFSPQHFENIFAKYDRGQKGGLSLGDVWHFLDGQRLAFDFFGTLAVIFEWVATYLLIWPDDGIMKKDDIRRIYDGSIFYVKAGEYNRSNGKLVR